MFSRACSDARCRGFDRALIHLVAWDPDSNELGVGAVRKYRDRFAIIGWFCLNERHSQSWVTDGALDWLRPVVAVAMFCRPLARSPSATPA